MNYKTLTNAADSLNAAGKKLMTAEQALTMAIGNDAVIPTLISVSREKVISLIHEIAMIQVVLESFTKKEG